MRMNVYRIDGMHGARCAKTIEALLAAEPGVQRIAVSFAGREARVLLGPGTASDAGIVAAVERAGYRVHCISCRAPSLTSSENARPPMSRTRWIAFSAGMLALLALISSYLVLHETGTLGAILDGAALRERVEHLGAWGPLAIVALMILSVLVSPIPSAPIAMAAGAAYGHGWGTLYVVAGAEAGALLAFALARVLGQAVLYRWFGERLSAGLIGSQNALTGIVFISRLLPFVSFDLVSYAAGLTALSFWRFALATLAGIVPASFLLAHLGLEMTDGEADRFMYSALALGLITAIPIALKLARDGWGRRSG